MGASRIKRRAGAALRNYQNACQTVTIPMEWIIATPEINFRKKKNYYDWKKIPYQIILDVHGSELCEMVSCCIGPHRVYIMQIYKHI